MPSLNAMARDAGKSKKTAAPSTTVRKNPQPTNILSTEFIRESDDEEDSNSDRDSDSNDESLPANPVKALPKVKGNSSKPIARSSSSIGSGSAETTSEDDRDEDDVTEGTTQRNPAALNSSKCVSSWSS